MSVPALLPLENDPAPRARVPLARKTILVVDDNPELRELGQLTLTGAGFEVVTAKDGKEALLLARQRRPDAILSDVLMPQMDGFSICRTIRQDPELARVPLVLMSAHYLEDEDRELAARFGANRYVSKLAGFEVILAAVLEVVDTPFDELVKPPSSRSEDLQADHLRRLAHQIERQAAIGAGLAHQVSLQATALSVLDGLSDSLSRQLDPESALGDTLAECLAAAGLSVGAILLQNPDGQLAVKAHMGSRLELTWDEHSELLRQAATRSGLMIPSVEAGRAGDLLLAAAGAASAIVVPLVARDETLGVLLLASNGTDLAGAEGKSFVRAARSVSKQLGQALALSRVFSKLAAAEHRYRALLANARDAINVATTEGVILEANRGWEEMLGLPRAQIVGRNIAEFAPEGEPGAQQSEYEKAVAQGRGPPPPTPLRRADGSVVHVELSRTVVDVGEERYVLSIGRDVSERLRLEGQLRQAQKMEAVGRFAGGVAHDFNNVLSVILSYGELLLADLRGGDPMREAVSEIFQAGKRAESLVRQLLMFSRQQVMEPRVLDLNTLLADMDKMLRRILGEDVELTLAPARPLDRIRVDPNSIEQVIMNLVINARDAMPTGGKLTIETANVTLDDEYTREHAGIGTGSYVMLAVSDTGIGIDKATRARIFEPFFTTKEKGEGTGLGLSTAFGIVQQSGGTIRVYSEPGRGTTFNIYLPSVVASLDTARPEAAPHGKIRGSETILLVEDEDQVRNVTRGILQRSGYRVVEARHAGEALLLSEQDPGPIHMLISDVVMPGMSGPELARRLAKERPDMRVLCMSGYTDDSVVRHGLLEANVAFIQKPITPEALNRKVREVLDASPARKSV